MKRDQENLELYLGELAESHKEVFLTLARWMVTVDGKVTPEENQMLLDAIVELELSVEPNLESVMPDFHDCCNMVEEPEARAFILLELASFAFVDHDYDARERDFLHAIAENWQVDPMTVIRIEDWAMRRVVLANEAVEIIDEISNIESVAVQTDDDLN